MNTALPSATVRMYRQGLGDCFLIFLPRADGPPYHILIDCGVILGTADAARKMTAVVDDIAGSTDGRIDLLVVTHEHWDHLSGFLQARESFKQIKVGKLWLPWTGNPQDELANKLRAEHRAMRRALTTAAARLRLAGGYGQDVDGLLQLFGAAGHGTTADAMRAVRSLCAEADLRYCQPSDEPAAPEGTGARLYVLGPPRDEALLRRSGPSKSHPETYNLASLYMDNLATALTDPELNAPFDPILQIPAQAAAQMPFFRSRYWGGEDWRRIENSWLDASTPLALHLDSATNNTSLALAIELGTGEVLLFAADAQVGSWLSWQSLAWDVDGGVVTGPDLLRRAVLYKAGHHGSHNATLEEKGLETMKNLRVALIPVDQEMAFRKGWNKMPLESLEKRLNEITGGAVLRADRSIPPALADQVAPNALYYEVRLPPTAVCS
ncbi:MAG TPA: MBL fold metallo-hydrolase [Bryobacteraceae bacterium]|nr:MBL fold metallo-hydrolase [Bryobacteraceae bacterium]